MSSYWARKAESYISSGKQTRNYNSWKRGTSSSPPATPPPPLGPLLKSLRINDLDDDPDNQHSATIQNCELVSSYNWLDTALSEPTILIPGKPPLWSPPPSTPQLREDSGTYHRDRNSARYPAHPLEPALITCLRSPAGSSLIPSLDIVACSSTLGNLLRFVRGQDKAFRILIERVGSTVFFVRRENSPTELIPDVRGYGHAFPEAYTTWEKEVKGSSSHQRIVRYSFGGMKMAVRFEADGYIASEAVAGGLSGAAKARGIGDEERDVEDLLSSLKVSSSPGTKTASQPVPEGGSSKSEPTLTIKTTPNPLIPQSQIFDLKTRSIRARGVKDTLSEELARLWISQIPRFILAYHTRGLFKKEDMEIKDVREDVKRWEREQKVALGKLVGLLKWIREVAGEIEGGKMEIVHREEAVGVLEVRKQGWPKEDVSLIGGKDGNKKGMRVRGDKVMSDAIRAQWVDAQKGSEVQHPEYRKDRNATQKKENIVTTERGHDHDGDTDENDDESDDGWNGFARPTRRDLYNVDDDILPGGNDKINNELDRDELFNSFQHEDDDRGWESDGPEKDFTACSLEDCGYCGRCRY